MNVNGIDFVDVLRYCAEKKGISYDEFMAEPDAEGRTEFITTCLREMQQNQREKEDEEFFNQLRKRGYRVDGLGAKQKQALIKQYGHLFGHKRQTFNREYREMMGKVQEEPSNKEVKSIHRAVGLK